jgi:glycosyltransferase involved in cell wall biosynthesis
LPSITSWDLKIADLLLTLSGCNIGLMPRIVIDAREFKTSSGRYVERLIYNLQQLDNTNQYLVLLKPEDTDKWTANSPNFTKVSCPHKEFSFSEQLGLNKQIKGLKADLVHFTFAQQPINYGGRVVTTIHDLTTIRFINPAKNRLVFKFKQKVYEHVVRHVARKSVSIIVPSKFVKDDLVEFAKISPDKVTVIYEAAEAIQEAAEPLIEVDGKPFLMYVGRPTPHKNLERLIQTFTELKASYPDLTLLLAGKQDANYKRIEASVKKQGISQVVFAGQVSEGQLKWLYEHCSAYVLPSLSEGFGLPGLEAMIHGAPLVSSNATCLPEIYGEAANYFDPLSVPSMVKAITEVLSDNSLRQKLVAAGKVQVSKYSWRKMAEQTLEIYNKSLPS